MTGSMLCVYETPCGWCSKWEKKCNSKIEDDKCNNKIEIREQLIQDEILHIEDMLNQFGISMMYDEKKFRPTNEVLTDICKILKRIRSESCCKEEFETKKHYILKTLLGVRYYNELY